MRDGTGSGTPGHVDALVRLDDAAGHDLAERAAVLRDAPRGGGRGRRRRGSRRRPRGPSRGRPAPPAGRRRRTPPAPATTTSSSTASVAGAASSPIRIFGPWRSAISASGRPASACTARAWRALSSWSSLRPVREVEPNAVHPGVDERGERRQVVRRRADGGDDLRAAIRLEHSGRLVPAEGVPARVHRVVAELLLDPQQLVVLRDAIGARRRAGLDLARRSRRPRGRRSSCPPSRPSGAR